MASTIDPNTIITTTPVNGDPLDATEFRAKLAAIKTQFENALIDVEALEATIAALPPGETGPVGPQGPAGPQGPTGIGLTLQGTLATVGDLPGSATAGDGYLVDGDLYVWDGSAWENVGDIQGPAGPTGATGATGATGPTGATGAAGAAGADGTDANVTVVEHGAVAGTARPTGFSFVFWIGTVEPTNATDGDLYFDVTV